MTLPNATLFPQALLPLYIFEPRYRQMLADALHSNRMFSVAMQRPGNSRETPAPIAGLGLIRVSVGHSDGTSHLILQGLARVELKEAVRYKPYRIQRIRPLETPPCDNVKVDALVAKVRELLEERIELGLPFPFPVMSPEKGSKGNPQLPRFHNRSRASRRSGFLCRSPGGSRAPNYSRNGRCRGPFATAHPFSPRRNSRQTQE
jgi:hypothetical protein